jgi:two-component system LytT family response regulator
MKKVILIDDEFLARNLLAEYLAKFPDLKIVAECENGFEGLKAIGLHKPDLVFLDIQMPKINGFEMLELLPEMPSIIFTTAFDEFALKAFEINAIDYLLKPFPPQRLAQALDKWRQQAQPERDKIQKLSETQALSPEAQNRIVIKDGSDIRIVSMDEIYFLEAYDDYVKIHTEKGYFLKKKTMAYYESVLDPKRFFRTHRSFFIQLAFLTKIETYHKNSYLAILSNGKEIPLSRSQYPVLKDLLGI